jgi:MerR family Zn(II)-responsive transcriptional regulator of zntA
MLDLPQRWKVKVVRGETGMRIGELADLTGTTTKALRFYEDIGLLPRPQRSANGYRHYDEGAVRRLNFIRQGRSAGLTLAQVREVLDIRDAGTAPCRHVAQLLDARLDDLDRQIADLQACAKPLRSYAGRRATATPPTVKPRTSAASSDARALSGRAPSPWGDAGPRHTSGQRASEWLRSQQFRWAPASATLLAAMPRDSRHPVRPMPACYAHAMDPDRARGREFAWSKRRWPVSTAAGSLRRLEESDWLGRYLWLLERSGTAMFTSGTTCPSPSRTAGLGGVPPTVSRELRRNSDLK